MSDHFKYKVHLIKNVLLQGPYFKFFVIEQGPHVYQYGADYSIVAVLLWIALKKCCVR